MNKGCKLSLHLKNKEKPYPKITETNGEVKGIYLGDENFEMLFLQGHWEDFYLLTRGWLRVHHSFSVAIALSA